MTKRFYALKRCEYCGKAYQAIRAHRSRFCCDQHGGMFRRYGANTELWTLSDAQLGEGAFSGEGEARFVPTEELEGEVSAWEVLKRKRLKLAVKEIKRTEENCKVLYDYYNNHPKFPTEMWSFMVLPAELYKYGYAIEIPTDADYLLIGSMVIKIVWCKDDAFCKLKPLHLLTWHEFNDIKFIVEQRE